MTITQQRRGLFWPAFAAAAFALLLVLIPQRESGSARLSARTAQSPASISPSFSARWSSWERPVRTRAANAGHGLWMAMLPVLFVGLVAPLELKRTRLALCASRRPSVPYLPSAFQRPPPHLA
ncbi:MAG TPA: hypothetical protein VG267_16865 [Terracidiphilus sp.]|nr:hypothetical protein [Terracidiphilus sp.]